MFQDKRGGKDENGYCLFRIHVLQYYGLIRGGVFVSTVRIVVTVVYIIACAVLVYLIYKGKGQNADLAGGIVASNNETYYSTHGRKHTEDARRERATLVMVAVFIVMSVVLNMGWGF